MTSPDPDHFYSALASLADTHGDLAAILAPRRTPLRFAQLLQCVVEIRATLNSLGIGRSDRVVAALPASAETALCFFGVAACATYVPLNPDYTEDEFSRYLARLQPKAVIVPALAGASIRSSARRRGIRIIDLLSRTTGAAGTFELRGAPASNRTEPQWATDEDIALILLTSGTTERPKLVPMKHRHLMAMVRAGKTHYALGQTDRCLHTMPMFHGQGLKSGLALPLLAGSGVICAPGFDVSSFFMNMATMQATWYSAGYTLQQAIFDRIHDFRGVAAGANLRFIVSGSGRIDPKVVRGLEAAFGAPVLDRYSTSETSVLTCEPLPPRVRKAGTAGVPVLNEIRIVDARGDQLEVGEEGEIAARGPGVIDGYLDDPELNARAFVDGWFRTGDVGRLDEDGYLTITGRIKELINRGGEKIAPTEVERVIAEHPAIARVCVFGIPHPTLGEEVAAAVVPTKGGLASERSIIEFARARLAGFKVPRRVFFTSEFPQGATGKTDRKALAYASLQPAALPDASLPGGAQSRVEGEVAALWQRILSVEQVQRDVDFFLSGGDSLKVAELVVAIQQRFGVRASMRQIFDEGATVAGLARLIERAGHDMGGVGSLPEGLRPLKIDGDRTPLFAIPGSDGSPDAYVHFCRLLDARQPLYGLQSRGLDGTAKPLDRIEDIAADHVAQMRVLQPTGPYFLIGTCFGGHVAYEMARQLEAAGERIGFLAMLDPPPPFTDSQGRPRGDSALRALRAGTRRWSRLPRFVLGRMRMYVDALRQFDGPSRRAFLRTKVRVVRGIILHRDLFRGDPSELHAKTVYEANQAAGRRYVPGPYAGAAIVVLTDSRVAAGPRNYRLDWLDLLPQCGSPRFVPGRNTGDMLSPPKVYTLATRINDWLEDAHAHAAGLKQQALAQRHVPGEPGALPTEHAGQRA